MGLFRKRNETYNQQMLREAGLDRVVFNTPAEPEQAAGDPPPLRTGNINLGPFVGEVGSGPLDWDAVAAATAPGIQGNRVRFTALPGGDLIVGEEEGSGDLSPLADAIEEHVTPPYKATAVRQDGDLWGVGAKRIEVAQFEFPDAEQLELTRSDGESELRVDGEPSDAAVPVELQRLGERTGDDFCVEAQRIDGDFWEVRVSAL